jgi:hypothetical protein
MTTWFQTRSGDGHGATETDVGSGDRELENRYLTDGTNLYRYLGTDSNGLLALENCRTLKAVLFSLDEIRGLGLRDVPRPT